ncbi:hypothetical protein B0H21DRAFT_382140 [Amylocystis lapponica]|nr:hypothetical protein B0H21DRAFT_382140 [Amylocystis lapponica]
MEQISAAGAAPHVGKVLSIHPDAHSGSAIHFRIKRSQRHDHALEMWLEPGARRDSTWPQFSYKFTLAHARSSSLSTPTISSANAPPTPLPLLSLCTPPAQVSSTNIIKHATTPQARPPQARPQPPQARPGLNSSTLATSSNASLTTLAATSLSLSPRSRTPSTSSPQHTPPSSPLQDPRFSVLLLFLVLGSVSRLGLVSCLGLVLVSPCFSSLSCFSSWFLPVLVFWPCIISRLTTM